MSEKKAEQKPLNKLTSLEALVYINRWAKHKDIHYKDRDILYKIKENYCLNNLIKEIKLDRIIKRENPTFMKIQGVIKNKGRELNFLDTNDYREYLHTEDLKKLEELEEIITWGFKINYSEQELENFRTIRKNKIEKYQKELLKYQEIEQIRKPVLKKYQKEMEEYLKNQKIAAKKYAQENNIKFKKFTKNSVKKLKKKGFSYEKAPKYPFRKRNCKPKEIEPIKTFYLEKLSNYQRGSDLRIDEILNWIESIMGEPLTDLEIIDEDFLYHDFQECLDSKALDNVRYKIVEILEEILKDEEIDSEEVYSLLTQFPIDYYKALEMKNYYDRRSYCQVHTNYCKWHEINLSHKGFWLVELSAIDNPEIVFHIPYNNFVNENNRDLFKDLKILHSNTVNYGRAINNEEMKLYPIKKLVEVFGFSTDDFPNELDNYIHYHYYNRNWEEEDNNDNEYDFI